MTGLNHGFDSKIPGKKNVPAIIIGILAVVILAAALLTKFGVIDWKQLADRYFSGDSKEVSSETSSTEIEGDSISGSESETSGGTENDESGAAGTEGSEAADGSGTDGSEAADGSGTAEIEEVLAEEAFYWDENWEFASSSLVHEEYRTIYRPAASERNGYVIAINAGHGSSAGNKVETLCHPDGTEKVTGGSTAAGSIYAPGNNTGTTLLDGTPEADVVLELALVLKDVLLEKGYDVLMLREEPDCDMDNIARTVYANNLADCHIALHYDSSDYDKGLYYTGVPEVESYRSMYPVSESWELDEALGQALVEGCASNDVKIWDQGRLAVDLTQTSYSTIASVDVEVGDRGSAHDQEKLEQLAIGLANGIDIYFGQ